VRTHVDKLGEGRAQNDPRRRVPDLERRNHARAQGLTEVDGPVPWVPEFRQGPGGGVRVGGEAVLAGAAGVAAVAAVVHEQDGESAAAELFGEPGPACPVAAVARCDQDRHPGVHLAGRRDEPGAQLEAVGRVEHDLAGTGDDVPGRGHRRGVGEVDQMTLQRSKHRNHRPPEQQHHEEATPEPPAIRPDHFSWSPWCSGIARETDQMVRDDTTRSRREAPRSVRTCWARLSARSDRVVTRSRQRVWITSSSRAAQAAECCTFPSLARRADRGRSRRQ